MYPLLSKLWDISQDILSPDSLLRAGMVSWVVNCVCKGPNLLKLSGSAAVPGNTWTHTSQEKQHIMEESQRGPQYAEPLFPSVWI